MHDLIALTAQIAAFAGSPPQLDPRLQLAPCAAPMVSWAATHAAVVAECPAPAWRIFVPLRVSIPPLIRRGDAVTVITGGSGFRVAVSGIADNDAAPGMRLRVRTIAGVHLTGIVGADGSVVLPGSTQ